MSARECTCSSYYQVNIGLYWPKKESLRFVAHVFNRLNQFSRSLVDFSANFVHTLSLFNVHQLFNISVIGNSVVLFLAHEYQVRPLHLTVHFFEKRENLVLT